MPCVWRTTVTIITNNRLASKVKRARCRKSTLHEPNHPSMRQYHAYSVRRLAVLPWPAYHRGVFRFRQCQRSSSSRIRARQTAGYVHMSRHIPVHKSMSQTQFFIQVSRYTDRDLLSLCVLCCADRYIRNGSELYAGSSAGVQRVSYWTKCRRIPAPLHHEVDQFGVTCSS